MVVCFLLLFLLIPNYSPSPVLRVSETNPSYVEATEVREMENMPKIQLKKRSLGLLNYYVKIFRQINKKLSEKPKRKPVMFRLMMG